MQENNTIYNSTYAYNSSDFEITYGYTSTQGKLASSTGNETGIYDLSGGGYEWISAYLDDSIVKEGGAQYQYCQSLVEGANKTKDIYYESVSNKSFAHYNMNKVKYGDAIYEVSEDREDDDTSEKRSWNDDSSDFINRGSAFMLRGGTYEDEDYSGLFFICGVVGVKATYTSFRPVLIVL